MIREEYRNYILEEMARVFLGTQSEELQNLESYRWSRGALIYVDPATLTGDQGNVCECGTVYIGQRGCSVDIRIKEHQRHIRLEHPDKSAIAENSIKNGVFRDVTPCLSCKNRHFGGT
jgi:hypothetical protein